MHNPWFVLVIKSGLSKVAEWNLANQGFENFFPRIKSLLGHEVDLLPGYAFVSFDPRTSRWQSVNATRGVMHMLPRGHEVPSPVRGDFVERVKRQLAEDCFVDVATETEIFYRQGDAVQIVSGAFAGFAGTYHQKRNKGWAEVITECFGHPMKTVVKLHQIKPQDCAALAA